ncbi:hypothetical protein [Paraflavitalea sp. CAU 1676]|nr:hypothetical protein [Paraflavitalea sp. CAU 1676]MDF2189786.1 hypothetical protein [Paraflavitalea sp. CAU 1676]
MIFLQVSQLPPVDFRAAGNALLVARSTIATLATACFLYASTYLNSWCK